MDNAGKIELVNPAGTFLENFTDPILSEQINGSYMFSFTAYVDENLIYIQKENLILVEGQLFEIARLSKKRGEYPSILVECDHVSYQLNKTQNTFEYDDTPASIVQQLLNLAASDGHNFSVGSIEFSGAVRFEPGEKSIRECLIELAGILGGEIYWDNYTVNIVNSRGSDKGLIFKVGKNVKEFTHETDYTEDEPFISVDLDVIDMARLPGYEAEVEKFKKIELGDSAHLKDDVLNIDEKQRVVSYDRNPFDKSLPKLSIGNVPRLFTDYSDRDKDDKDGADERTVIFKGEGGLYVGAIEGDEKQEPIIYTFKAGAISVLDIEDADFTDEFFFDTGIFHPEVYLDIPRAKTVIRIAEKTLNSYNVLVKIGEEVYSGANFKGETLNVITRFPNDVELYVFEGEMVKENIVKAYGATVLVDENNDADQLYKEWFKKIELGGVNVLAEEGLDKTHEAIEGLIKSPPIIQVPMEWGNLVLEVQPDKFRDYFIRVSAFNIINGRSIRTYNKNGFSGNTFTGGGWGPFAVDRETARYVIQFRTDNGQGGSGIERAFAFNGTLTLPEDLDEWPSESDVGKEGYFIEFGRARLSDEMYFEFKNKEGYDGYAYVSHAIMSGQETPTGLTVSFNEVYEAGKIVGVEARSNYSSVDPNFFGFVTIQAVCGGEVNAPPPE